MENLKQKKKIFSNYLSVILSDSELEKSHRLTILIFAGTLFAISCLNLILILSMTVFHNEYVASRLFVGILILPYLALVFLFIRRGSFTTASWMLICLYGAVAFGILAIWSINAPIGILTLAFVIFLSSIMLGTNYIIPVTLGVVALLFFVQLLNTLGILAPNVTALAVQSKFGDVVSYSTIFGVYALIAWIAGSQRRQAMRKMKVAEIDLQKERDLLEIRLEERTKLLRKAQFEEMRQLYHFAELGQLTTIVLHELSNSLSVLNLDIDDLKHRRNNSNSINQAQESIRYLDSIVKRVRLQLKHSYRDEKFNPITTVRDCITQLESKSKKTKIKIELNVNTKLRPLHTYGDPLRLSQILIILINNSFDAYSRVTDSEPPKIKVNIDVQKRNLLISVEDYGPGIPQKMRENLFVPRSSSKQNGLGIGLFIAQQIVETHFKGSLRLLPETNMTKFLISLPLSREEVNSPKPPKHSPPGP